MKLFLSISALLFAGLSFGQTTFTVSPLPTEACDITLSALGSENEGVVGKLEKTGKGIVNLGADFSIMSDVEKSKFPRTISEVFMFCDNMNELFNDNKAIEAFEVGPFVLMKNNVITGIIMPASNQAVFDWYIGPEFGKAAVGSAFEMVYMSASFTYQGECTDIVSLESGDGDIETNYQINLDLKKGLNFIEYKYESVYEGDDRELSSTPKKVIVTTHQTIPSNAKWFAFYSTENFKLTTE